MSIKQIRRRGKLKKFLNHNQHMTEKHCRQTIASYPHEINGLLIKWNQGEKTVHLLCSYFDLFQVSILKRIDFGIFEKF